LFREYTDATFKTRKPSPPEHGLLGPVIRAEVGDKIVVHFKNKLLFNASVQLFGGLAPIGQTTQYQVGGWMHGGLNGWVGVQCAVWVGFKVPCSTLVWV
jgi:FtsP/CotA-like multicopper oxidase with cupredoxin domain